MADEFCTGPGRVMMAGFQSSVNGTCILWLFKGAVLNDEAKYGLALAGTFLMAFLNEAFTFGRKKILHHPSFAEKHLIRNSLETLLYGIQMVFAYWMMLLVMTYESGFFTAIIMGLVCGHLVFGYLQTRKQDKEALLLPTQLNSGTPCCGSSNI